MAFIKAVEYDFYIRRMPELIKQFPSVFDKKYPKVLSIGIDRQIAEQTDFTLEEAGVLMKIWTARREYKAMGCSVNRRHDLDGFSSPMSEAHMQCFIGHFKKFPYGFVPKYAEGFKKQFKRPAFLNVPIPVRIEYAEREEKALAERAAKRAAKKNKRKPTDKASA